MSVAGESVEQKKGPDFSGPWVNTRMSGELGSHKSPAGLLLFLRSSLLLCRGLGSFLGCVLHRLILPKHQICDLKKIAV